MSEFGGLCKHWEKKKKRTACTVGWLARLCCSWLSPGKATRITRERNPNGTMFFFSCRRRNIAHTELFIHVSSRPFHSQRMYTDRQNNNTNFPCESCRDTPPRGYDSWSAQTADDQPSSFAPKTFSRSCYGAVSTDQLPRNLHAKTLTSKVQ